MKAELSRQFLDAFNNKGGDFAFQFEGTPTRLTIPWCDIICASNTVMIFGAPFSQARSFPELFRKKKHSMHIISFVSSLQSITVILGHVRCYVLHTNKLGWMLPLPIWLCCQRMEARHCQTVYSRSHRSIPPKCNGFSISSIAIVNMHTETA